VARPSLGGFYVAIQYHFFFSVLCCLTLLASDDSFFFLAKPDCHMTGLERVDLSNFRLSKQPYDEGNHRREEQGRK